ncbi:MULTISPECIES: amidohydrolase [unclassified Achromobacter]|uniref:amidohydrolase family protein n=1 Tax=unclassified Achromobacter TaxID=2626865 RepID=UPI001E46398C|nr:MULTISPECIES: amidohydrolase family protein [unclassified Achromobacter]
MERPAAAAVPVEAQQSGAGSISVGAQQPGVGSVPAGAQQAGAGPTSALPAGACDCHVHIVGEQGAYPMLPDRPYTAGPATVADLRAHMARLGLARAVIVQPSFYGTDNRLLVDSLAAMNGDGRGIAVLAEDVSDATLTELHDAGVRGVRINLESVGASDPDKVVQAFAAWAGRLRGQGWHIQTYASLDAIAAAAPRLRGLGLPVVLDHFSMIPARVALDDARVREVMALVGSGAAYVKLSGSYRVDQGATARQVTALAQAFLQANPERAVWASDWPHTNRAPGKLPTEVSPYRDIDPRGLRKEIDAWLPEARVREQVLVSNPARLYGF